MGNKERILALLKENKAGMTAKELDTECKIGDNIYVYLKRLIDDDFVENIIPKNRVGKVIGYRATEKAFEQEIRAETLSKLKDGVLELNKLMSIIKPKIPSDIDKNKIKDAIESCLTI